MNAQLQMDFLLPARDLLGECPLWDDREQVLYWIDARRHRVQRWDPSTGATRHWTLPHEVGSIALCESGRLLVALVQDFLLLDPDTGALRPLASVTHAAERIRLNDGRTDRAGRFCVGSLVMGRREPLGALYQLQAHGQGARVRELDRGFCVSNTTAFSPDGRSMYFADSLSDQIRRYPYDPETGELGPHQVFVDTQPLGSGPDGATVDAEGALWVALVLKRQLARFLPDGRLDRLIDLPVPYPTCPCFGGPQLDTLYVTSISDSGNLLRSEEPSAGALVAVQGLGVRGLPEARFADLPLHTQTGPSHGQTT